MTSFMLACAGLVLLSGLFFLLPRAPRDKHSSDIASANLDWYRLRQSELLAEGGETLLSDIDLRLLEDDAQASAVATEQAREGSFPRWILMPVMAVVAAALYYQLGAAPDVIIDKQLKSMTETGGPEEIEALVEAVEVRALQRPDNLHYASILGQYYMDQEDYQRASALYGGLAEEAPGDAQALAMAAQAEYLAGGRDLSDRAQMYAEQALAIDPHQRTALGLLGMASFEQQQYRAAIEYWQRLLDMEPADSEAGSMIAGVIEMARQKLGPDDAADTSVAESEHTVVAAPVTAGVTVRVSAPVGAQVNPGDTVFVLAREAYSDSRMPVAVQRLSADRLPVTLRLDDSNSMAGQKLSSLKSIVVIVQVSPDGRPGETSASWLGQAGPLSPSLATEPLDIELIPRER